MIETLKQIDTSLFLILNGAHNELWDFIMFWISEKITWIPFYAVLLFFIIRKFRIKTIAIVIAFALLVTLCDQISVHFFKDIFQRLRPSHEPLLQGMVHLVGNYKGGMFGFVSSHAANTFGFAMFSLLLFQNRYYSVIILLWAILVSYSRIYLGVHYPFDVVGGAILGCTIAVAVYLLYKLATKAIFKPREV